MRIPSRLLQLHLLALLLLDPLLTTSAARITFTLPTVAHLPAYNPSTLPPSTRGTLLRHAAHLSVPLTRRNTFEFANVTQGSWLFTVQCRDYNFGPLRVDVVGLPDDEGATGAAPREKVEAYQTFWGNEWRNTGEWRGGGASSVRSETPVVVEVRPDGPKNYFMERGGFSPLDFLKNPMMLMAVFSLVLIVGIPYLTENMDEETRAEFEEIQKKSPVSQAANSATGLQNFDLASWMAGKSAGTGRSGEATATT